ncbi:hypothetical protein [Parasphingorhabdus halotolerans]|uniref:Uncharacterized protein n=1 Tax=Parasphingorhabdus halotolerans TaxID=2725558 RepID=A0A6H2DKD4_9SPHN|nr:hypothetical protein [Parasphingorhabdus halotolerans]QJB68850.1 hypothetical protein HF685_05790 [Parasphingorhabdus halotolerans]
MLKQVQHDACREVQHGDGSKDHVQRDAFGEMPDNDDLETTVRPEPVEGRVSEGPCPPDNGTSTGPVRAGFSDANQVKTAHLLGYHAAPRAAWHLRVAEGSPSRPSPSSPSPTPRHDGWTLERRVPFLKALVLRGAVQPIGYMISRLIL